MMLPSETSSSLWSGNALEFGAVGAPSTWGRSWRSPCRGAAAGSTSATPARPASSPTAGAGSLCRARASSRPPATRATIWGAGSVSGPSRPSRARGSSWRWWTSHSETRVISARTASRWGRRGSRWCLSVGTWRAELTWPPPAGRWSCGWGRRPASSRCTLTGASSYTTPCEAAPPRAPSLRAEWRWARTGGRPRWSARPSTWCSPAWPRRAGWPVITTRGPGARQSPTASQSSSSSSTQTSPWSSSSLAAELSSWGTVRRGEWDISQSTHSTYLSPLSQIQHRVWAGAGGHGPSWSLALGVRRHCYFHTLQVQEVSGQSGKKTEKMVKCEKKYIQFHCFEWLEIKV